LFQAMAPMSDVPAGAFWTAALVASLAGSRTYALIAGLSTAIGLLIRPNLLPLAVVPTLAAAISEEGRERWIRVLLASLPVAAAQTFIAALNSRCYGSPLVSGYGSASELYSLANVWPNVKLYASWFLDSESGWALVGLIALLPIGWKHADRRAIAIAAL